jgi:NADH-quinone oxidoreductase subunit F
MAEPVLMITSRWADPAGATLDGYLATGGYEGAKKALAMKPEDVIDEVKRSGLRGRGGAGFPTGTKWSFIPQGTGKPVYVVCNADESEPGTFNNRELMERDPHQLIEGILICSYAVRCQTAFIYCRGEFVWPGTVLERALREAYAGGYLGADVMGTGYSLDIVLHRGSGAYICGEETALLNSLEGLRGQPRLRPPFPAVEGLYASPTVINNVETLSNVPHILLNGAEWFAAVGTEKSTGTAIYSISGKVERPGTYEAPMGTTARVLIEGHAGGVLGGRQLKAWTPGGSSTPFLTADHLDTPMDFESVAAAGSLLGTKAMMVVDETDCIVGAALRFTRFYAHESCGKCTNCREGTWWLERVLRRIEAGIGRDKDIDLAMDIGGNMLFKAFCALADGAVSPVDSSIKYFRDEYEQHLRLGRCPFVPEPEGFAPTAVGRAEAAAADAGTPPDGGDALPFGPAVELDEVLG